MSPLHWIILNCIQRTFSFVHYKKISLTFYCLSPNYTTPFTAKFLEFFFFVSASIASPPVFSSSHSSRLFTPPSTKITHYSHQCLHVFTPNSNIPALIFTDFSAALGHSVLLESLMFWGVGNHPDWFQKL